LFFHVAEIESPPRRKPVGEYRQLYSISQHIVIAVDRRGHSPPNVSRTTFAALLYMNKPGCENPEFMTYFSIEFAAPTGKIDFQSCGV
jgi:hypothetical protein